MADETRTPDQVAREVWDAITPSNCAAKEGVPWIAALIREERKRAFEAGATAQWRIDKAPSAADAKVYATARRLAVEGRSDG